HLIPQYCECPTWCCIEKSLLQDGNEEDQKIAEKNGMKMIVSCKNVSNELNWQSFRYDIDLAPDELLPGLDDIFDEYNSLLIAPLSYQGECMGYLASAMDCESFNFLFAQRIISTTNQIFETLKTKIRLQKAYAKVADMHMRDPMTGIYNRRGFYMRMSELAESGAGSFSLFSVDVDRLKKINDTFGHSTGDKAILTAADIINKTAGTEAVCARFGGDEFVVVIPDGEDADNYIDRVYARIDSFNASGKEQFVLSVSIGNAVLRITDRENIDIAMKSADERMYECKRKHHSEI
ncbi:MAG: GGDEF domain-containing protein, partial [Oscillospiraceae bacterium]|nr:GGDEF domain-containing protein [Oscillospiraceae bacterium]